MAKSDKIETVQEMQDYIAANISGDAFSVQDVYEKFGYSKRNADRIFKELIGKTPAEYIRSIKLTRSAGQLLKGSAIIDVALDTGFETHEGYTRAFSEVFGVPPKSYKNDHTPIPLFVPYSVRDYYSYINKKENTDMENKSAICTVTCVSRPERKLIVLRSKNGKDYWSFCEEMGCEWEGMLNSIPEKFDTAAFVELPEGMIKKGTSFAAAGVEVPAGYDVSKVPEGYDVIDLKPCHILYFQTEPFEKEEDFGEAITAVFQALERYKPENYGYAFDPEIAPRFNFGAGAAIGAKLAVPVKKIS